MPLELSDNVENTLKSNVEILFEHLKNSITEYIDKGECMGELKYINAYLSATINAIVSYIDKLIEVDRLQENDVVEALKFINNLHKHNPHFVSVTKRVGGFSFPMSFPLEIECCNIVWSECIGLTTKKKQQKEAYENIFQHREILDSLTIVVNNLLNKDKYKKL